MTSFRPVVMALALAAGLVPLRSSASDARVLDAEGMVLTVGQFALIRIDGGGVLRAENERILSWELHDEDQLLAYGVVPGTSGMGIDATPVLSLDQRSGRVWLAWSRQALPGAAREIALIRFDGAPIESSLQIVGTGHGDQLDPALIHDEAGWGFVAWVDASGDRPIRVTGFSPSGDLLPIHELSAGMSTQNTSPQLGIDAHGGLFATFLGLLPDSAEPELQVLTALPRSGGVSHVPNPLVNLAGRASLQVSLPAPPGSGPVDLRHHLTVLGGTPLAWWTENTDDGRLLFRYVAEGEAGWTESRIETIDMSTGMLGSVADALALVEARLRRVVSTGAGEAPIVGPTLPGDRNLGRVTSFERR